MPYSFQCLNETVMVSCQEISLHHRRIMWFSHGWTFSCMFISLALLLKSRVEAIKKFFKPSWISELNAILQTENLYFDPVHFSRVWQLNVTNKITLFGFFRMKIGLEVGLKIPQWSSYGWFLGLGTAAANEHTLEKKLKRVSGPIDFSVTHKMNQTSQHYFVKLPTGIINHTFPSSICN